MYVVCMYVHRACVVEFIKRIRQMEQKMTLSVRAFIFFLSEVKTVTNVVRCQVSFSATAVNKLNMIFARAEDNIRRHTLAYVSRRQHTSAYASYVSEPSIRTTSFNHFFSFFVYRTCNSVYGLFLGN